MVIDVTTLLYHSSKLSMALFSGTKDAEIYQLKADLQRARIKVLGTLMFN